MQRHFIITPFVLFLFFLFIATAFATRGIKAVPIKDKQGNQVGLYKESHALVIGVSDYTEGWPDLPGVVKDVRLVKEALEANGFNVVVKQDLNHDQFEDAFKDFINQYGHNPDARLLFYFAGHGHTLRLAYGGDMGYIIPTDTPNPNRNEQGFLAKAMSMEQIEVYAKNIQAKHAMFLFDSCFSGSIFALSRAVPKNISYKTSEPVRQFITAGSANETVPDESIFRGQFVRALQGEGDTDEDGYLTGVELGEFLQKKVVNYSNESQHPQYGKIRNPFLDKGDFVFPLNPEDVAPELDAISEERRKLEEDRKRFEEQQKKFEERKRLAEERRKLEMEKQKLKEEQMKMARLEPQAMSKPASKAPLGMVEIPGGEFVAGLDPNIGYEECTKYYDKCKRDWFTMEGPEHTALIDHFYMDKHEVTQGEFEQVMGKNPSNFKGSNRPVEKVTWHEADEYCRKVGKRLPTEAEWEKAAKGGRNSFYPWGNAVESGKANFCDRNCDRDWKRSEFDDGYAKTAPVGSYPANGYGLYDMAGNVSEWVADWYEKGYYRNVSRTNPKGPSSGKKKVLRGGSWVSGPGFVRAAYRLWFGPSRRDGSFGFRCAEDVSQNSLSQSTINQNEKLASLEPPSPPKPQSSSKCPEKMSYIPAGVFMAGEVDDLKEMSIDAFCMDQYEVTQADYEGTMRKNLSQFKKGGDYPVENVTWKEARAYCEKLGKRLPFEWEWEKAAKAGTGTEYYWGHNMESGNANFCDVSCPWNKESLVDDGYKNTSPVGSFQPNPWGLYDMVGNVWEWTMDWKHRSGVDPTTKIYRGGSWYDGPRRVRTSSRSWVSPLFRFPYLGFRCAQ